MKCGYKLQSSAIIVHFHYLYFCSKTPSIPAVTCSSKYILSLNMDIVSLSWNLHKKTKQKKSRRERNSIVEVRRREKNGKKRNWRERERAQKRCRRLKKIAGRARTILYRGVVLALFAFPRIQFSRSAQKTQQTERMEQKGTGERPRTERENKISENYCPCWVEYLIIHCKCHV